MIHDRDYEVVDWRVADGVEPELLRAALAIVAPCAAPAAGNVVRAEIARLRASCVMRDDGEAELTLRLQVLGEECQEWPPDVVREACHGWARREKFFPSLAELLDELQRRGRARRSLLAGLRQALAAEREAA